jgi:hypothetical protein
MATFDIDIGHGRILCIEASDTGVEFNSYANIPCGKVVKVSAKSILLDLTAWEKFNDNIDLITKGFDQLTLDTNTRSEFSLHLGKFIYVKAVSTVNCVNIRQYFFDKKGQTVKPGRPGVSFKFAEFKEVINYLPSINKVANIESVESCCTIDTEADCEICNP